MTEDQIVSTLCDQIREGKFNIESLNKIRVDNSSSNVHGLGDLIGANDFDIFKDTTAWNTHPKQLVNIAGGTRPDIVLRSKKNENRIIIEAKCGAPLRAPKETSQVVRYLLHLLATSLQTPDSNAGEIRRAVLLAAPDEWFENKKNNEAWHHFRITYEPLARGFGVTLGEIRIAR